MGAKEGFLTSKTLLFADDSATMRLIMEKTFQGEDFAVVTVPSGQAAIEKAKELTPEIIIADAGMTGVNGYDVCEAIRKEEATATTPVVIMSGISNPYDESRGKGVGATEHVKKPFDTTKLIERVKELSSSVSAQSATETVPTGVGVAPARPNLNMPPVPQKDLKDEQPPSIKSTLHAFPRPGLTDDAQSVQPMAAGAVGTPPKSTDTQPVVSRGSEPTPIEIAEEESGSAIQVGTLAELAQMNDQGDHVQQEVREDAIELDSVSEDVSETPVHQPAVASQIQEAASQAAAQIAGNVEGLTSEQAQAIMALTEDVVEKVVWEVVPDLAEAIIREKLDELLKA